MFSHLFLPEENAAPFPPLTWILLICNPVYKKVHNQSEVQCSVDNTSLGNQVHTLANFKLSWLFVVNAHFWGVSALCESGTCCWWFEELTAPNHCTDHLD